VVLVDRTNSTRSTPGATPNAAPDYPKALGKSIDLLTRSPDEITVGGFDGSSATLVWTRSSVSVRPVYENERNQEEYREQVADCLVESVRTAAATPPNTPDTDVLGNLTEAAKYVEPDRGNAMIIMATDGLTQGGCVDLRAAAIGDDAVIDAIRKRCRRSGELPKLEGIRLVMFGIGHSGPTQPGPTSSQAQWLERLWQGLCEDTGASCWVKTVMDLPVEALEAPR